MAGHFGRGFNSRRLHQPSSTLRLATRRIDEGCPLNPKGRKRAVSHSVHYVYLLKSESHSNQRYTGLTSNLKARLTKHDEGGVPHTFRYRPWALQTYIAFSEREQAAKFEQYLKSGSGRAFAQKRLWS